MKSGSELAAMLFEEEFAMITEPEVHIAVMQAFSMAPKYFFEAPASLSRKYHPKPCNEDHGLVKHTKYVCWWANEIMQAETIVAAFTKNSVIAACLLHDMVKFGTEHMPSKDPVYTKVHGLLFVKYMEQFPELLINDYSEILYGIAGHMGKWSSIECTMFIDNATAIQRQIIDLVHRADYCASRLADAKLNQLSSMRFDEKQYTLELV